MSLSYSRNTPVLFIVFNRPDTTDQVFGRIREAQPAQLFIAADGPRKNRPDDQANCEKVRNLLQVDWDCQVKTLYRETNLGCKKALSSAIDWFFEHVEEGIILEDDCLPSRSFFAFCENMLSKYRHDERIMHIGGSNFQFGRKIGDGSYYFSRVVNVWGWATWRRAWDLYDINISTYPHSLEQKLMSRIFSSPSLQKRYEKSFSMVYNNIWDNWDQQWIYTIYTNSGMCVVPNINLISNIGFGSSASSEYHENDIYINMKTGEIEGITDPVFQVVSTEADDYVHSKVFNHPPLYERAKRIINKFFAKN